jgi:ubiquinone/menaquinone biosynthesis C-methylase UbiE
MGWYDRYVLPRVIQLACSSADVEQQRALVVPEAEGRVLEVGMGPGLNLPFYDRERVEVVWAAEPNEAMHSLAADRIAESGLDVRWLGVGAEALPLDDDSVDTVVLTYTLCSIPDWETALAEIRRVLRPGGRLLFSEHGEAPDEAVRTWQHRVDPVWTRLAGGCHITRPIPQLIESAGFLMERLDQRYLGVPKIATYQSTGVATPS